MMGEDGMVTYKINKKRGAPQDDRISSIQIRQVKKKKKNVERSKKVAGKDQIKRKLRKTRPRGWRVSPWISRTPCFLSWISGVTKENTKTG
jgi:hypothetical protein